MLTLITATGARPHAFGICQRLMAAQDYEGDVRWIVVDDGEQASPITFERDGWTVEVVRPEPFWQVGQNTQARNMLAGLALISSDDRLVVIEDDDHYKPDWLSVADAALSRAELVGEYLARYYNVSTKRAAQLKNSAHSSLCSTALRGSAIQRLKTICERSPKFIDLELWRTHRSKYLFGGHRVTGIKGLPGRGGIGMGHKPDMTGIHDTDGAILRAWVGNDAELYQ
jgi:hypothetical protein